MVALERFPEDWERALAIVAHPDDLEYGTASAVARCRDAAVATGRDLGCEHAVAFEVVRP